VTKREEKRHLTLRQQKAEKIIDKVLQFKVCEQCLSISFRRAPTCSVCGAYRFDERPGTVRETARKMGTIPFPLTSGTVPRIRIEDPETRENGRD